MPNVKIKYDNREISNNIETVPLNILYGGNILATLNLEQTKILKCAHKLMLSDINIGSKTIKCNNKIPSTDIEIEVGGLIKLIKPTLQNNTFTYNKNRIQPTILNFDSNLMNKTGTLEAVNTGSYQINISIRDISNYSWNDNTQNDLVYNWTINKKSLSTPSINSSLTYTGSSQTPTWKNFDTEYINISGDTEGTNAGTYTANFSLKDTNNCIWSDNTTTNKTVNWSIAKANGFVNLSASSISGTIASGASSTINITSSHGGNITVQSGNTSYATCSVEGNVITVTHGGSTGSSDRTVTFTVICAATDNYQAATKTFTAKFAKTSSCVAGDTLIMMGDGTEKPIREVKRGDMVMTYSMDKGSFEPQEASIFWDEHKIPSPRSLNLTFDDDTLIKVIWEHGFFDKTLNTYSYINYENYQEFIGHDFVAYAPNGYKTVKLIKAEIVNEVVDQYSLETSYNDNFITNGLISMTQEPVVGRFEYFKFSDNVTWDFADKQAMIDTYGLYTYDEWKEYIPSEEMFNAWNGPYFKILMGKGIITMDDIWYMLQEVEAGTK